jgi:outer membrane protein assembly factor BamB
LATGTERWRFATADAVTAAPALVGDTLYVGGRDSTLYAIDTATGTERWRFILEGSVDYGPVVAGGVAYVGTTFGIVYAIGGSAIPAGGATPGASPTVVTGIQEATPTASPGAAAPVEFVWEVGGEQFEQPADVAVSPDGSVWVVDQRANHIQLFEPSGALLETWGGPGTGESQFRFGDYGAVSFDGDGNLYVLDTDNHRVQKFDPDRNFVTAWGRFGTADGEFIAGSDIAVAPDGTVYVIDVERRDVQTFTSDGTFLFSFDGPSVTVKFGADLARIGVDADGNLYVPNGSVVHKFAPDGTLRLTVGSEGGGDGQLGVAIDAAANAAGHLFVSDAATNRIQVFDENGHFLAAWGGEGTEPGQFDGPDALSMDADGNIYVLDFNNKRIQKFRLLPPLATTAVEAVFSRP